MVRLNKVVFVFFLKYRGVIFLVFEKIESGCLLEICVVYWFGGWKKIV